MNNGGPIERMSYEEELILHLSRLVEEAIFGFRSIRGSMLEDRKNKLADEYAKDIEDKYRKLIKR